MSAAPDVAGTLVALLAEVAELRREVGEVLERLPVVDPRLGPLLRAAWPHVGEELFATVDLFEYGEGDSVLRVVIGAIVSEKRGEGVRSLARFLGDHQRVTAAGLRFERRGRLWCIRHAPAYRLAG